MGVASFRFDRFNLPEDILIYVDRCGVDYLDGDNKTWGDRVKRLKVATSFRNSIRGRDNFFITGEIFQEFDGIVDYFKDKEAWYRAYSMSNAKVAKQGVEVYGGLRFQMWSSCNALKRRPSGVSKRNLEAFFREHPVHKGEESLLWKMFSRAGENGFLSADAGALKVCRIGLEEFNLPGRVYDLLTNEVELFIRKKASVRARA